MVSAIEGTASNGGGSATAAGVSFQTLAAAWYCVGVLAEQDFVPPLELPSSTVLNLVHCETGEPVDDFLVGTTNGGFIFGQAKNTISLSESGTSDFAAVAKQFVRQFLACRAQTNPGRPWNRPLDASKDRLVLVVGPESSGQIRSVFSDALDKVRQLAGRPLRDAPTSDPERRALDVFVMHASAVWQATMGAAPSEAEIVALLELTRVQTLDLGADRVHTRDAKTILRGLIETPAIDELAWTTIASLCLRMETNRGAVNRYGLQQALESAGIVLNAPRDYRDDIGKLAAYSTIVSRLLSELASFRAEGATVKIARDCVTPLREALQTHSLLLTGEPGAGKSGVLHELATSGHGTAPRVVLLVDRLAATSLGELRQELNLEHELSDVLQHWPGTQPGLLIIDALDAAREEHASQTIRDLIRLVLPLHPRWRVVASIRKFDLRYGQELQRLFAGPPPNPAFIDPLFGTIQHFNVGRLSDGELSQLTAQSPKLHALISAAPAELQGLMEVPYNIRLLADLLESGVAPSSLSPIRTQLELLDRYWLQRIIETPHSDQQEAILDFACEDMTKRRSMYSERRLFSAFGPDLVRTLLSKHVLTEWSDGPLARPRRELLGFSHHVLHDYAIARLLLRREHGSVLERLKNADFALIARPSISLHFRHLWAEDRAEFWRSSFAIIANQVGPRITDLIGPTVAADEVRDIADLQPLLSGLQSQEHAASVFLGHLVGAIFTAGIPIVGDGARPWVQFVDQMSTALSRDIAFPIRSLIGAAIDKISEATPRQREQLGSASRALLEFAWLHLGEIPSVVSVAIQGVARTINADQSASTALLGRVLDPEQLRARGFLDLPWLSREIKPIIKASPELAVTLYRCAFAFDETSKAETSMGSSRILPLTSTRAQDYEMALWELGESFKYFLDSSLSHACRALVFAMQAYEAKRHAPTNPPKAETFTFRGQVVRFSADLSEIWDVGSLYAQDDAMKMLEGFQRWMTDNQDAPAAIIEGVADGLASMSPPAIIWRRILIAAAAMQYGPLCEVFAPVLGSMAILAGYDTSIAAGNVLLAHAGRLPAELLLVIEDLILSITNVDPHIAEPAARIQARLLGCIDAARLQRQESRVLLQALSAQGIPPNRSRAAPELRVGYEDDFWVSRLTKDSKDPSTLAVVQATRPVRDFDERYANAEPTLEAVSEIIPVLRQLDSLLAVRSESLVVDDFHNYTVGHIATCAALVVSCVEFDLASTDGEWITTVLLRAASNPEPKHNPQSDEQFERHPGWGTPAARIDAARGLLGLVTRLDAGTEGVKAALRVLSSDTVAPVRYQVAGHLLVLYGKDRVLFWELVEAIAAREENRGVLLGLVSGTLTPLAYEYADRVVALLEGIRRRVLPRTPADELLRAIGSLIAQLYVYRDNAPARAIVDSLVEDAASRPGDAESVLHTLRMAMVEGDASELPVRTRAIGFFAALLPVAQTALETLEREHGNVQFSDWPADAQTRAKGAAGLIKGVADQTYFASGAFDVKRHKFEKTELGDEFPAQSRRFYTEASALIDRLTTVRLAAASHHVVETIAFFAPLEPARNFIRIAESVRSGTAGGYQYESLGNDLIVEIVERYLAEFRYVFRENDDCRRLLLDLLDTFVTAGWPSARKLTHRLDEISR